MDRGFPVERAKRITARDFQTQSSNPDPRKPLRLANVGTWTWNKLTKLTTVEISLDQMVAHSSCQCSVVKPRLTSVGIENHHHHHRWPAPAGIN